MIEIKQMNINQNFRYLWLKYVNNVNLNEHCAKCLIGEYSKQIKKRQRTQTNITLNEYPAKYYYLCGVAFPFKYENNFHLAFKEKKGNILEVDENGINLTLKNAERIFFSKKDIDPFNPHANKKGYNTCRNWQFANKIKKAIMGNEL